MDILNVKDLYLPSGYINWEILRDLPFKCKVVVGGRGGGKTYGALKSEYQHKELFMYLRRTQKQLRMIMKESYQPFAKINQDLGIDIHPYKDSDDLGMFKDRGSGEIIGMMAALSTIAAIRGFDGSKIKRIIYDEFIPEQSEVQRFDAADALWNAHETINRNRELDGDPPVELWLLSNSNTIYGEIIMQLRIGSVLWEMQRDKVEVMADPERSLMVFLPQAPVFKARKSETFLYKLTEGSEFQRMALNNEFVIQDERMIRERPIIEYKPLVSINDILICRHKSRKEYYVTDKMFGSPEVYKMTDQDLKRYKKDHPSIVFAQQNQRVYFKDLDCQSRFFQVYS